jgi:hypothetical protein
VSEPSACRGWGGPPAGGRAGGGGWGACCFPRTALSLVLDHHLAHPSSGPRPPPTAPWVTVMTSTIEGAGTSSEESAATMTVPEKEMKDGGGTIGMTGETLQRNFIPPYYSVLLYLHCVFL